jgi:hypothetical protein
MSKAIATNKIGGDLYAAGDLIWDDQAGPNGATVTSAEFLLAQTMGETQLKLVAGTAGFVTGGSNRVTIKVLTASATGGSFDKVLVEHLLPISTTYAAGDVIFSFVLPREETELYTKISATVATDNLSAYDLTAYQVGVC